MNTIRDLANQGLSIRRIAEETGIARNTIRKYLRHTTAPPDDPLPRKKRRSKLDPFKAQILHWIEEDHLFNCETMLQRLKQMGYTGAGSILREFVKPFRPAKRGRCPVIRYETRPGEQMQIDWGEFVFEEKSKRRRLYGLTAVLSYSRMRFVCFFKRCDTSSLLRGIMQALEYFAGVPKVVLSDRMKSVLVSMEDGTPHWNPRFADFTAAVGMIPRVCKAYTPQTKGKVERSISIVQTGFWPGVTFSDLCDLNEQALAWCAARNAKVHRTTGVEPVVRIGEEVLSPLPTGYGWERFRSEERKVSWDGYVSYDGVLYGLPGEAHVAGTVVSLSASARELRVWKNGVCIAHHLIRSKSGTIVTHPDQFKHIPTAHQAKQTPVPLGHLRREDQMAVHRPLGEYDHLFQVSPIGEVAA